MNEHMQQRRLIPAAFIAAAFAAALGGCAGGASMFDPPPDSKAEARKHWDAVRGDVKRKLAESQYRAGHLDEAVRETAEALELNPRDATGMLLMARIRLEQGQLAAARRAVAAATELRPGDAEAAYVGGIVAERYEDWEEALRLYTQASETAPTEADYLAARAEALVALGRAQEAFDLVEARLAGFDDDARLRRISAEICRAIGKPELAIERLQQAAQRVEQDAGLQAELGLALAAAGRDMEAVGILEPLIRGQLVGGSSAAGPSGASAGRDLRAADQAADDPLITLTLARCCLRLQRTAEAQRYLADLLARRPDDGQAWLLLAQAAMQESDWKTASKAARQARRYAPEQALPHLIEAFVAMRNDEPAAAVAAATIAAQKDPADPTGHCVIGQCCAAQGDLAAARTAYETALRRDPTCELARSLLAKLPLAAAPSRSAAHPNGLARGDDRDAIEN